MKVLIIGGTGMIGTATATYLREQGDDVTVAARTEPAPGTVANEFPVLLGDYSEGGFNTSDLAPFEGIVFAAGNDIRHIPADADRAEFWEKMQIGGVPRFAALAKEAGVPNFVQLGSYYHQVLPELVETDDYVRARALADERARALGDDQFTVSTLNAPNILGVTPGPSMARIGRFLDWADGKKPEIPNFTPAGGTNYMSVHSLAEAVGGALRNAETGTAYLLGDANLAFREYFQMIFDAAGSTITLVARDEEHPMLPDAFIVQGRGNTISYETDPAQTAALGYTQGDAPRAIAEMVAQTRSGLA
ncbi:NAD(P)-dependent oxidoreductase [Rhodococcus sp. H29-C3]|uniref:NAD-dependent epimerase/dehydratase family protein n=1 Tax=Rhodococcus sp. H29-C3 TaxID=3046307 RepID=UPI0024BA21DD|nr:NAD(P)-dependent oxidoreductase [Rhodococcus sp. H29-C3]MDJ0361049.1 NAD(P)-dependent oxidoreductase [Rhodococcus sp. H29-C3]